MAHLRATLVAYHIEEHMAEIRRILAPGGYVFMSFELFHYSVDLTLEAKRPHTKHSEACDPMPYRSEARDPMPRRSAGGRVPKPVHCR